MSIWDGLFVHALTKIGKVFDKEILKCGRCGDRTMVSTNCCHRTLCRDCVHGAVKGKIFTCPFCRKKVKA